MIFRKFRQSDAGSVAVIFGLALPVVIAMVAAAVDYGLLIHRRNQLQNAADTGALAAARELSLAAQSTAGTAGVASALIRASVPNSGSLSINSQVVANGVEVTVREQRLLAFGNILGGSKAIEVRAIARISSTRLCLLALEEEKGRALDMNKSARLTGIRCSVFSNSKDKAGIVVADSAMIDAETVCSAGGIDGKNNFARPPTTDCPPIADPLANRSPPNVGACQFNKMEIKKDSKTLNPGVYCGGLRITGGATVNLTPGIYIIQGGKLVVDQGASLEGDDVGLYLSGKDSSLEFGYQSTISLAAPRSGPMAGILIFDDRSGKVDKHRIYSDNARKLLGTIYMPNGQLYIDAKRPIADRSAYTVVVARTVEIFDGPDLTLNSDYGATDVPVPKGVGPIGSTVSLVR
jgi:hypothetical protein